MMAPTRTSSSDACERFNLILARLVALPAPLLPPSKVSDASLTDEIASLYVHPALEALLHLLNQDLYSAHFLVRHMQAAPAFEGMYAHGILHRLEGDYDNARAWYGDVAESDIFKTAWRSRESGLAFIGRVQTFKEAVVRPQNEAEKRALEANSVREIRAAVDFCIEKFGKGSISDARKYWTQPEGDLKKLGQDMVSGDKGLRKF